MNLNFFRRDYPERKILTVMKIKGLELIQVKYTVFEDFVKMYNVEQFFKKY